jgi:exportin-1
METYIKKAEDLEAVNTNFMPPLLDAILGDYNRNVPTARDAEVLNVMATITSRLGVSSWHVQYRVSSLTSSYNHSLY